MNKGRCVLLLFILSCLVVVIVQCTQVEKKQDSRGPSYAGSSTCVSCHKDLSDSYVHNAHFNTSRLLTTSEATDSLGLPVAEFVFNDHTKVGVEHKEGGLFQVAYTNGKPQKSERTDMVFGAGLNAYTFAYWNHNQLMQLPLNYLTKEKIWVNSPGFPEEQVYFGRPIVARCMECHSSYVDMKIIQNDDLTVTEEFVKGSLLPGIDCERCHGPASKHVSFHQQNPEVKEVNAMVRYQELPLSRKIDMCGVCHSGIGLKSLTSSFAFKPGDTLKSLPQFNDFNKGEPDVHGNQKQLLEASACFKIGKADCVSCHDVHLKKKPNLEIYSNQCKSCHQDVKHAQFSPEKSALLAKNCIDCHMPVKKSSAIGFQVSNSKAKVPYRIRTHRIAIYKELMSAK